MSERIAVRKWISRRACGRENKCKQTGFSITFFCWFLLLSYFSHLKSFEPTPGPSAGLDGSTSPMLGFTGAEQICLSPCLFVLVFVFLIVCVYAHFCSRPSQVFLRLWQFSAWSPLICLSVYLLSQHSWFICIYISRKWQQRITFTLRGQKLYISGYLFTEGKVYFCDAPVEQIHRCFEFYQIWSEVSLKKYDKCLWEDKQCSVNSITLATYC